MEAKPGPRAIEAKPRGGLLGAEAPGRATWSRSPGGGYLEAKPRAGYVELRPRAGLRVAQPAGDVAHEQPLVLDGPAPDRLYLSPRIRPVDHTVVYVVMAARGFGNPPRFDLLDQGWKSLVEEL